MTEFKNTIAFGTTSISEFDMDKLKIAELKVSTNPEDRVTAILMDEEIGSCGYWEPYAREKAKAILEALLVTGHAADNCSQQKV